MAEFSLNPKVYTRMNTNTSLNSFESLLKKGSLVKQVSKQLRNHQHETLAKVIITTSVPDI